MFFNYPNDAESYNNMDEKAMIGDAFILFPIFNDSENDTTVNLPPGKWNYYYNPRGKVLVKDTDSRKVDLSGKLDIIHLYMRGGVIVPWQNTFDNYIKNSYYLRQENLNLIINVENGKASGVIIFDNDGINTIENKDYIRIDLNYENNVLNVNTIKKDGLKYDYNDNILGILEIWGENVNKDCKITINTKISGKETLGPYNMEKDKDNEKFYYDLSLVQIQLDEINNVKFDFS